MLQMLLLLNNYRINCLSRIVSSFLILINFLFLEKAFILDHNTNTHTHTHTQEVDEKHEKLCESLPKLSNYLNINNNNNFFFATIRISYRKEYIFISSKPLKTCN